MAKRKGLHGDARDKRPGKGEQAGEAVGGIGGTLAGAGLGSVAGPIGTIVGGLAGAVGGWWAGEKAGRAAEGMPRHEDEYRRHYRESGARNVDYDTARVGYGVGHIAGANPAYRNRPFEEVEEDLRRGWRDNERDYDSLRPYVRYGFETRSHERD